MTPLPPRDEQLNVDATYRIRLHGNTAQQRRQAALVVCDRAHDPDDAAVLLAALELDKELT